MQKFSYTKLVKTYDPAARHERYLKNREHLKTVANQYYHKNRERYLDIFKVYYEENKARLSAKRKRLYQEKKKLKEAIGGIS